MAEDAEDKTLKRLDEVFDKAYEAVEQMFREVERGSPEHAEALAMLQRKMRQLERTLIPQQNRN